MCITKRKLWGYLILQFFIFQALAQQISVQYNKSEIALNEYFSITLTVKNERLREYSGFPEIEGFVKRGTSSGTSTTFTNGQMTSSQSITQNYQATKEGSFQLPNFSIKVNGNDVNVTGTTIKVGAAKQQQQRRRSIFDDFFSDPYDSQQQQQPKEYIDVEADAFLALTTDKQEVYVGEGFTTTLAFYIAESNQAKLQFYDLTNQLSEIVKKIKPANTWEENFNIENITREPVTINGKRYLQYKLFQAAYYPLSTEDIDLPSVDMKMIKYKVAKNPSFWGRNQMEDFETFKTRSKHITVKPLPPHPLKDAVAVGKYKLAESISTKEIGTGKSFNYVFSIVGEGNISGVEAPEASANGDFDFYPPNIQQDIQRASGRVKGTKSFQYYAIPNEPGTYDLGDYFQWIYFDTEKEQYDTLRAQQQVVVTGESRKNEYIMSNDMGAYYDGIELKNNELKKLEESPWIRIFANLLILIILVLSLWIAFRK